MKQMIKKLLVVALLLSAFPSWAYDFSVDGIYYTKHSNGKTVYVTGGGSYSGSVVIPSKVTCSGTTYSVTSIGSDAFYKCSGLTSVTIPNSVTSIGESAFEYCSGLKQLTIQDGTSTLSLGYNLCNSAGGRGEGLFYDAPLESVYLGRNLSYDTSKSCGYSPFYGKSTIKELTIGNSVTEIGVDAFYGTAWYDNQPDGLVYAGQVAYKYKGTMPDNTSITIKDGTLGITGFAFSYCSGLTSVTIPNSVTSIGEKAFYNCSGLTSVSIGNSVTEIGSSAFQYCRELTSVTIPNSVTEIGQSVFYGCSGLTSVTIGNSVTSIGDNAFSDCSGLTSVTIGNSVTSIGNYVFYKCSGLTSVTIPNSVTSIGNYAFYNCSGLTSVVFNAENCTAMGSLDYPVFYGCSYLTSLTIGESVKKIPSYAFYRCSGLTSVTIPNSVTSISTCAFCKCSGLTSMTIPNSVTSIGGSAFYGCSALTDLTIGSSVNSIGASAFDIARLGRIRVLNPVPPTCVDNTVFKSVDKENCLLTVPHGTIDLYSTTYVWWDFKRMKEDNGQGDIAIIDSNSVSVTATSGAIRVEGAEGAEAEVYSYSGALLYRGTDSTIALPRGIYIVKVAGMTTKVIL